MTDGLSARTPFPFPLPHCPSFLPSHSYPFTPTHIPLSQPLTPYPISPSSTHFPFTPTFSPLPLPPTPSPSIIHATRNKHNRVRYPGVLSRQPSRTNTQDGAPADTGGMRKTHPRSTLDPRSFRILPRVTFPVTLLPRVSLYHRPLRFLSLLKAHHHVIFSFSLLHPSSASVLNPFHFPPPVLSQNSTRSSPLISSTSPRICPPKPPSRAVLHHFPPHTPSQSHTFPLSSPHLSPLSIPPPSLNSTPTHSPPPSPINLQPSKSSPPSSIPTHHPHHPNLPTLHLHPHPPISTPPHLPKLHPHPSPQHPQATTPLQSPHNHPPLHLTTPTPHLNLHPHTTPHPHHLPQLHLHHLSHLSTPPPPPSTPPHPSPHSHPPHPSPHTPAPLPTPPPPISTSLNPPPHHPPPPPPKKKGKKKVYISTREYPAIREIIEGLIHSVN
ncbi:hypothetical protein C7M84_018974 [Penaeus vannamei]|uniref:Uncharacterized protein n=1 Tax=Penaeus vannamei TaxID=6689 RepID=A0A423SG31_PENVA|nr:hypothetical protein C7M84_018974 [Penaeus vannamei]